MYGQQRNQQDDPQFEHLLGQLRQIGGMGVNFDNGKLFYFSGNAPSLKARIDAMSDEQVNKLIDANITVSGIRIKDRNHIAVFCTSICGFFLILPLFLMCCNWWRRCFFANYEIPESIYFSLVMLMQGRNMQNIMITVTDNYFGAQKAKILCEGVSKSCLKGFSFTNAAMGFDMRQNEYSDFEAHMAPIRQMPDTISDIRWTYHLC